MKIRTDQLLYYSETPEYETAPLSRQQQKRIQERTMEKIKEKKMEEEKIKGEKKDSPGEHFCKPRLPRIAVAAAAVLLFCGSVYAAKTLSGFELLFGRDRTALEDEVETFSTSGEDAVSAEAEYERTIHATAEQYHYSLIGLDMTDTMVYAEINVSRVSEEVCLFSESGLELTMEGLETKSFLRFPADGGEQMVVYAGLQTPLEPGKTISFSVSDGSGKTAIFDAELGKTGMMRTMSFDGQAAGAACALESAILTETSLTVTGHLEDRSLTPSGILSTAGGLEMNLYSQSIAEYDYSTSVDDGSGWLAEYSIDDSGSFRAVWVFTKHAPLEFCRLTLCGVEYELPLPSGGDDGQVSETTAAVEPVNQVTSVETKDYRFTLDSIAASSMAVYAIIDMEPLTEYGVSHMNLTNKDFFELVGSTPASSSAGVVTILDSSDETTRYLLTFTGDERDFRPGDKVLFEILSIKESGDTAAHSYPLFETELGNVLQDTMKLPLNSDSADGQLHYTGLELGTLSLRLTAQDKGEESDVQTVPEITLHFADGTQFIFMDETWVPGTVEIGNQGVAHCNLAYDTDTKTVTYAMAFSKAVSLEEIDKVTIDGETYNMEAQ